MFAESTNAPEPPAYVTRVAVKSCTIALARVASPVVDNVVNAPVLGVTLPIGVLFKATAVVKLSDVVPVVVNVTVFMSALAVTSVK